jgi:hypothetical protein
MSPVVSELDEIKTLPCGALIDLTSLAQHNKAPLGTSGKSKKEKPWETPCNESQTAKLGKVPFAAAVRCLFLLCWRVSDSRRVFTVLASSSPACLGY